MYPFLYFASRPGDWFEGANMGHLYELRFATAPSADQRRAIGEAWGRETAIGNVDPGPWRWADAWALVKVGERRISEPDAFFRKMERVLRALHDVHPLAEVVFWGARDVTDNASTRSPSVARVAIREISRTAEYGSTPPSSAASSAGIASSASATRIRSLAAVGPYPHTFSR